MDFYHKHRFHYKNQILIEAIEGILSINYFTPVNRTAVWLQLTWQIAL